MENRKGIQLVVVLILALPSGTCAPLQPPSATGPRGNEPVYPLLMTADNQRREAATAALTRLVQQSTTRETPQLQPITATIESLPSDSSLPLYLPRLGAAVMNEEETRESLRRFIREWRELIGTDPAKLSLLERVDQPDGTKLAIYEQRPFRFPIRGNFGRLRIQFTPDRRVMNLTSTCIPNAERLQPTLAAVNPTLTGEDAIKLLSANPLTYIDTQGAQLAFRVNPPVEAKPRQLVIYIVPSKTMSDALDFHIAWEIGLSNAPAKAAYVDAVNGEIIATE